MFADNHFNPMIKMVNIGSSLTKKGDKYRTIISSSFLELFFIAREYDGDYEYRSLNKQS
jgi:hypothetical protein